jgi:hypothetical protein
MVLSSAKPFPKGRMKPEKNNSVLMSPSQLRTSEKRGLTTLALITYFILLGKGIYPSFLIKNRFPILLINTDLTELILVWFFLTKV